MGPAYDASSLHQEFGDVYDETRGLLPSPAGEMVTAAILRLAAAGPATRFLEPGVGSGRIAFPLVRDGYRLVGVDTSHKMLDSFRRKLARANAFLPSSRPMPPRSPSVTAASTSRSPSVCST